MMINLLLSYGANADIKNKQGKIMCTTFIKKINLFFTYFYFLHDK